MADETAGAARVDRRRSATRRLARVLAATTAVAAMTMQARVASAGSLPTAPVQTDTTSTVEEPPIEAPTPPPTLADGDSIVVGRGGPSGFVLLVPDADAQGGWAPLSTLSVQGMEAGTWTGYMCVTGSGRYAAVTFAPAGFANRADLRDRGAFAAIVDTATGDQRVLPERVALKYHTPGCGAGDEVVFVRHLGVDQESTEILRVDAATATVQSIVAVPTQVTSAVPSAAGVVGVVGNSVVSVGADGSLADVTEADGQVFDVHAEASGELVYLVHSDGEVNLQRTSAGETSVVASGPVGAMDLVAGRNGEIRLVGQPVELAPDSPQVVAPAADAVSLDGSVVVASVEPVVDEGVDAPVPAEVSISATSSTGAVEGTVDLTAPAVASGGLPEMAELSVAPSTACAVPRNDDEFQVLQPFPNQIEWAAHRAVRDELTLQRPANWRGYGLPAYTARELIGFDALDGGGRIPAQILLGVLAQESNFAQASWGALPGVPGNPLIANYYGSVYGADGRIIDFRSSDLDCGTGIGQITDGMRTGNTRWTATQQLAIGMDYTANIAAAAQILTEKWDDLLDQGTVINGGDPANIESWYLALWGYNTGVTPPTTPGFPYGLGWTNNPANNDYNPNRAPFLRNTYEDAAHPGDWPYQERVLGWAERAQVDHLGVPKYTAVAEDLSIPYRFTFCVEAVNDCIPGWPDPDPAPPDRGNCTRIPDRLCRWHGSAFVAGEMHGERSITLAPGEPASGANPHPPACDAASSDTPMTPDVPSLPGNAVIVDDVATTANNLVGCAARPSAGTFTLTFNQNGEGDSLGAADFHQIGAGHGGHFWYTHTNEPARTSHHVRGTWDPPDTASGWQHVYVHIPDHGADTYQARYEIAAGDGRSYFRIVNQRWNANVWVDLGIFDLRPGATVSLSSDTYSDYGISPTIAWDAVAFVPSAKPTVSYVALGDSYQAGEGVEPYYANTATSGNGYNERNACHRSPEAYPVGVYTGLAQRIPGEGALHFLACSGATTNSLLGAAESPSGLEVQWGEVPQLEQGYLDENTTHVSVGIGGNDARFGAILQGCVMTVAHCLSPLYHLTRPWDGLAGCPATNSGNCVDPEPLVDYQPQVIAGLEERYRSIIARIRAAAPNARITLVGYPQVVRNPVFGACAALFDQLTVNWFDEMGNELNQIISDVAADLRVRFANMSVPFEGHEACAPTDEWLNAFVPDGLGAAPASFHPKATGHISYMNEVLKAFQAK